MTERPKTKSPEQPAQTEFKEGVDYYFENGLMVLTADFSRKRDYCCGSGCRHCPYPKPAKS